MTRFVAVLLGLVTLVAAAKPSPLPSAKPSPNVKPSPNARPSPSAAPASFDLGVWTVHASSLNANFKTGDFNTPAKVVMTRTGGDVTADKANGNYKKQMLFLNGHVVMHDMQGGAATGLSDTNSQSSTNAQSSGPSTLTADKAQIDGMAKMYKAIGNVRYVQADTVVTADNGILDNMAHTLLLEGAVHIVSGTRNMTARKVLYNTTSGDAHAEGNVTIQFPSEFHRQLATPKPLKIPKNPLTEPVNRPSTSP
jgi:lipopolysaccharide assembly outer membrane protein LptD (OstA)